MIYLALAFNFVIIVLAVVAVVACRRDVRTERDRAYAREDSLLNRIQKPQLAAAQSLTEQAPPQRPAYISAFDDEAAAQYEQERDRLMLETHALVTADAGLPE